MKKNRIGIIVLNFNNWKDTIHTIKSILNAEQSSNHALLIIDNNSTDSSFNELSFFIKNNYALKIVDEFAQGESIDNLPTIHLIKAKNNKGYAAGNNIGFRFFMKDSQITHYWVLNNDTELANNVFEEADKSLTVASQQIGIWGTLLVRFYNRNLVQALGGKHITTLGKTVLYYENYPVDLITQKEIEKTLNKVNYLIGASLIFRREMMLLVGLFDETYFLYCEEVDFFTRLKQMGFEFNILPNIIVYHKEGGTTLTQNKHVNSVRNTFLEYHNCRSKLIFAKKTKHFGAKILFVVICLHLIYMYRKNIHNALEIIQKLYKEKLYA
ncbi:MAG: glycosyltransferase [Chitinophagaceae bacterium]